MKKEQQITKSLLPGGFRYLPKDVLFLLTMYLSGRDVAALICVAKGFAVLNHRQIWIEKLQKEFLCFDDTPKPRHQYNRKHIQHFAFSANEAGHTEAGKLRAAIFDTYKRYKEQITLDELHRRYVDCLPRAICGELEWFRQQMSSSPAFKALIITTNNKANSQAYSPLLLAAVCGNTELCLTFIDHLHSWNKTSILLHVLENTVRYALPGSDDIARHIVSLGVNLPVQFLKDTLKQCMRSDRVTDLERLVSIVCKDRLLQWFDHAYEFDLLHIIIDVQELKNFPVNCVTFLLNNLAPLPDPSDAQAKSQISLTLKMLGHCCVKSNTQLFTYLLPYFEENMNQLEDYASAYGQLDCLKATHRRKFHMRFKTGVLPVRYKLLYTAAKHGHKPIVSWLTEKGLDPTLKDVHDHTALEYLERFIPPKPEQSSPKQSTVERTYRREIIYTMMPTWEQDSQQAIKHNIKFSQVIQKLTRRILKNACTQYSASITKCIRLFHGKLLKLLLPNLTELIANPKPAAEDFKKVLGQIKFENKVSGIDASTQYYYCFNILEHLCAIHFKSETSIKVSKLGYEDLLCFGSLIEFLCYYNMHNLVRFLLEEQIEHPKYYSRPLTIAYRRKFQNLFEMIYNHNYKEDQNIRRDLINNIVLPAAVDYKLHEILKSHCKSFSVEPNHQLPSGDTILHVACRNQDFESISVLTDAGWTLNTFNTFNLTPLQLISEKAIIEQLVSWAIDNRNIRLIAKLYKNPVVKRMLMHKLHLECKNANLEAVKGLLTLIPIESQQRYFMLKTDSKIYSALHYAVMSADVKFVADCYKLVSGLPIDHSFAYSSTPMQLAVKQKDKEMIIALFKLGETAALDTTYLKEFDAEKELQPYLLINAKQALLRSSDQFISTYGDQAVTSPFMDRINDICDQLKENNDANVTLLKELRQAFEDQDINVLNKAAQHYQTSQSNKKLMPAIMFGIAAIALTILGATLLALGLVGGMTLPLVIIGAIALTLGVGCAATSSHFFYQRSNYKSDLPDQFTTISKYLGSSQKS